VRVLRRLRRLAIGESGPAPALVLAGVSLVVAFISLAGARGLVSADNSAIRQALGQLPAIDAGTDVSADLTAWPSTGELPASDISGLQRLLARSLPSRPDFAVGQDWAGATMPLLNVTHPAPSAESDLPPVVEVVYRTGLAARSAVIAGSLPAGPPLIKARSRGKPGSVTFTVAVTKAMASRFSLRVGSVIHLSPGAGGDPAVLLKVAGIVRPLAPSSSFWQVDPAVNAPSLQSHSGPNSSYWLGGAFIGSAQVRALAIAYQGRSELASWFFPLRTDLTAAEVPRLESALAGFTTSAGPRDDEAKLDVTDLTDTSVSSGLAQGLSAFTAQWQSVQGPDSLLLVGLFAAGAMLLFISAGLAVQAYRPELVLLRVRGGSVRQLAAAMVARSGLITVPALAAGLLAAVVLLPVGGGVTGWVLGALTAAVAIGSVPVIAVAAHRQRRGPAAGREDEVIAGRPRLRRLVGELLVVAVAAAAITDLRLRGAAAQNTDTYLSISAVLVAAAVGLIVNRAYRGPLRGIAKLAGGLKGPVAAVGLTRAALSRTGSVWPALTLMLTLTLVAFSAMVTSAVSAGQVAASWAQVGADVQVAVPGLTGVRLTGVTASQLRAVRDVAGVRQATAVYTASSTGTLAVNLTVAGQASPPLGLAVVTPASYAALAATTPWPRFPAGALARPRSGTNGVVPVLVSPQVRTGPGRVFLEFGGLNLPVKIIGTITDTAAMPAGGSYLVLPAWAAYRLPSIPPPTTVLLAGSAINLRQLNATVNRVFPAGCVTTVRSQVLSQLTRSPALHLSESLYESGAAAAGVLGVLAVLFALASSARSRSAMMTRLAALGMTRAQALALGLTDALPLLVVAAIGSAISGWLLAAILAPVLGLGVFTGGSVPVTLAVTWPAVVIPIALAAAAAVTFLALDGLASGRREVGAALRLQEASQT
jgi:putative ABC transport system permease protein